MINLITLHEAVILVLIKEPNRTASYNRIAEEIERRNLFPNRKGGILLSEQVKLRTSISSSKYKHMFEKISKNEIRFI